MNYQQWLNVWLTNYVQPTSKFRTFIRYRQIVQRLDLDMVGSYELSELSAIRIQSYLTELLRSGNLRTKGGLSPNSVNAIITVIQSSLKTAYEVGLISEYFGDKLRRPKQREKRIECFSLCEQRKIEKAVLSDGRAKMRGIVLCLYTGIRLGELLALTWADIQWQEGVLSVRHTCYDGVGEDGRFIRMTDTPKTPSSRRDIPLPQPLRVLLQREKKNSRSPYVVANEAGDPLSVRSYQRSFELLLKKLKIEPRGFHALRHTFATRALECGMDVKTLSEILGHKNPTVTLNRYAHSMMKHKKDMMNKLGQMLI